MKPETVASYLQAPRGSRERAGVAIADGPRPVDGLVRLSRVRAIHRDGTRRHRGHPDAGRYRDSHSGCFEGSQPLVPQDQGCRLPGPRGVQRHGHQSALAFGNRPPGEYTTIAWIPGNLAGRGRLLVDAAVVPSAAELPPSRRLGASDRPFMCRTRRGRFSERSVPRAVERGRAAAARVGDAVSSRRERDGDRARPRRSGRGGYDRAEPRLPPRRGRRRDLRRDHRSTDGTSDVLARLARTGRVHVTREESELIHQATWMTRLAYLAGAARGRAGCWQATLTSSGWRTAVR